jgi:hypothetical protein
VLPAIFAPLLRFRRCRIGDLSGVRKPKEHLPRQLAALAQVFFFPQRLEVRVVERSSVLLLVQKIKSTNGNYVIYVPHGHVFPAHAVNEQA